jgi:hypothetical protein
MQLRRGSGGGAGRIEAHRANTSCADATKAPPLMHLTAPASKRWKLSREASVCWSLLIGWGVFLIGHAVGSDPNHEPLGFGMVWFAVGAAGGVLGLIRLAIYEIGHAPPISLWGRLWTGRWIVPGYDSILLTPVAVGALGAVCRPRCSGSA